jgi:hypothetical protein
MAHTVKSDPNLYLFVRHDILLRESNSAFPTKPASIRYCVSFAFSMQTNLYSFNSKVETVHIFGKKFLQESRFKFRGGIRGAKVIPFSFGRCDRLISASKVRLKM